MIMAHNGFTMNGEKDPARRAANLKERIAHLQVEKARPDDQIEIMSHELHGIEVIQSIKEIEAKAYPGGPDAEIKTYLDLI